MSAVLFKFQWKVDQDGYTIEVRHRDFYGRQGDWEYVVPRGTRWRYYRPLEDAGLWLRVAETCRTREGVLQFVGEFGLLHDTATPVEHFQIVAERLWTISQHLRDGDRRSAAELFNDYRDPFALPMMYETIIWSAEGPELAVVPRQLEDALKHQAADAITSTKEWQFRPCRNAGCPNWFRVGPRAANETGTTFTARREFCSDRCRVAWSRRNKREAAAHA